VTGSCRKRDSGFNVDVDDSMCSIEEIYSGGRICQAALARRLYISPGAKGLLGRYVPSQLPKGTELKIPPPPKETSSGEGSLGEIEGNKKGWVEMSSGVKKNVW